MVTLFRGLRNLYDALIAKKSVFARVSADVTPAPHPEFGPFRRKTERKISIKQIISTTHKPHENKTLDRLVEVINASLRCG